jgi:hypothetical protein
MAVYLSGPITGTDNYRERYERAEKHLMDMTHEPIANPLRIGKDLKNPKWIDYMEKDLEILLELMW